VGSAACVTVPYSAVSSSAADEINTGFLASALAQRFSGLGSVNRQEPISVDTCVADYIRACPKTDNL